MGTIPQDHYEPKSNGEKWLDNRLPIGGLVHHLATFPTPKNLNYAYVFGGILALFLVLQIVTGIWLAMNYKADATIAFQSVEAIMRDKNGGWLLRYLHSNGASFFFIAVYLHIFRGLYYGSYKAPREILWIIGVLIYLLMMATAFMGYVLPWGQMSYWGATVITNLFSAIPFVGEAIKTWLLGGFAAGDDTLNRFFSLHYLLPFAIAGLTALHIWALHHVGNTNPTGVEVRRDAEAAKKDTVPFNPYYTVKDLFAIMVFLIIFAMFVFYMPNYLGHADNYIEADPLVTPAHIVPEWYFLPFYAILRSIPDKLMGVVAMFAAIAVLAVLPWLDTSRVRSGAYRPAFKQFFWAFVVCCLLLGYVGAKAPDDPVFSALDFSKVEKHESSEAAEEYVAGLVSAARAAGEKPPAIAVTEHIDFDHNKVYFETKEPGIAFKYIHLGQILTLYYFAYFLLILPLLGITERTLRTPDSIEADFAAKVAKKKAKALGGERGDAIPGATPAE